jgi:hypothetical protein
MKYNHPHNNCPLGFQLNSLTKKYQIAMHRELVSFTLGKETSEYLQITVRGFAYPDAADFAEGNWLDTRIKIKVGGFMGDYEAQLQNVDFLHFRTGLARVYDNLDGYANFNCPEDHLEIIVKGDGIGHFTADCIAKDGPGIYRNELRFNIEFDQTEIPRLIRTIDDLLTEFPIKDKGQ